MKRIAFCDIAPCILIGVDWCFSSSYSLMVEAVRTSETSVHYKPEGCPIPVHRNSSSSNCFVFERMYGFHD
jgi:hypothetical protein